MNIVQWHVNLLEDDDDESLDYDDYTLKSNYQYMFRKRVNGHTLEVVLYHFQGVIGIF